MTDKRFHYDSALEKIYDYDTCEDGIAESLDCFDACELLNELNDENIKLKSENNHYRYELIDLRKQLGEFEESIDIRALVVENQRLIKMLDNVANYMQKQNKDVPLDDFVEWWNKIATEGLDD